MALCTGGGENLLPINWGRKKRYYPSYTRAAESYEDIKILFKGRRLELPRFQENLAKKRGTLLSYFATGYGGGRTISLYLCGKGGKRSLPLGP